MIAKFTQGKEKLDDVIKWAEKELEGTDVYKRQGYPRRGG